MLHQIKAQKFYTDLDLYQQSSVLPKIEESKDFSRPFNYFPVLFKAYIIFKDIKKPFNSSTFHSCVNPGYSKEYHLNESVPLITPNKR